MTDCDDPVLTELRTALAAAVENPSTRGVRLQRALLAAIAHPDISPTRFAHHLGVEPELLMELMKESLRRLLR